MDTDSPRPHDTVRSQLRLPAALYQKVVAACQESGHSMNAEIVTRLEQSFSPQGRLEEMKDQVHALKALNRMTAFYLFEVAGRVPESKDALSNFLMELIRDFALNMGSGDLAKASEKIEQISTLREHVDPNVMLEAEQAATHKKWPKAG